MFLQLLINGVVVGSIYSVVALGFALVYNTTRIFHITYAAIYMFSPYILLLFIQQFPIPFLLAVCIAILLTILLGIIIELIIYKPLMKIRASSNVILVSSLGVLIIIVNVIALIFGNETQFINRNISNTLIIDGIVITYTQIVQFCVSIVIILFFLLFLKFSRFGIKTRAMRDDSILCTAYGMDIRKMRIFLFALSSFFAAVGGVLIACDVGMDPYVGMSMFLNAVVALIIGGIGKFEAPILGGFIIGILQAIAVWTISSKWQDAVTFSLLILFLLFRPQGLLGEKHREV